MFTMFITLRKPNAKYNSSKISFENPIISTNLVVLECNQHKFRNDAVGIDRFASALHTTPPDGVRFSCVYSE